MILILAKIYKAILVITFIASIYYAIFLITGLFRKKLKYKMVKNKLKFCIFVPCHNESKIIKETVNNYMQIEYNTNLFDIYFIADNCSDSTASDINNIIKINNIKNFFVLNRNELDKSKMGKPHAIRWGIEKLEKRNKFYQYYDMLIIFDADNFVDSQILNHFNSQYLSFPIKKRPVMIQAYLDSKNKDSFISRGYYVSYRIVNGFWQQSKQQLGLNPAIGGTGFAIDTAFLKNIGGFKCTSLTEDLEIQTIATLQGKSIEYNGNVRVYDEKPTRLKESIVQKTRWAQGHWFNFFKFFFPLLISLFNFKKFKTFFKRLDLLFYLAGNLNIVLIFINFILGIILSILGYNLIIPFIPIWLTISISIFSFAIIPLSSIYDGNIREQKNVIFEFFPNLFAFLFYSLVSTYSAFVGLIKCGNQKVWKKTEHKVTNLKNELIYNMKKNENAIQYNEKNNSLQAISKTFTSENNLDEVMDINNLK